ncbi:phospholipase D-like domain-containing protein [Bdellovibrio sp. HCB185ZH]|uniref:phospholipase D-like domain-containing protein n=1 Tax=Bdellovibrio sp. HCB185ZH TaxID=3394235 RepID=UPI0039A73047
MASPQIIADTEYLPTLLKLLDRAEKTIDIMEYSFAIGSATGRLNRNSAPFEIADKLIEIKESLGKKIRIRLYIEGYRETASRNMVTAEYLKEHGIEVVYGATHAKGFCIDNKFLLFGSTNLTQQSILKNHETNLLLNDKKAIAGFNKYFEFHWKGGGHGGVILPPPMIADGVFKDVLVDMIDRAEKSLNFSIYFFHISEIEKAFIRAHKRKVKITGLIHHHDAFALSYVRRTRGTAERMNDAGIKDLHYGPGTLFTHSKFLVMDNKEVMLGTGNWLHEDVEVHPQLYIHLKDPTLATNLTKHLQKTLRTVKRHRKEYTDSISI